jgi:hypothetical protein
MTIVTSVYRPRRCGATPAIFTDARERGPKQPVKWPDDEATRGWRRWFARNMPLSAPDGAYALNRTERDDE